jgi:hypothetical protein
MATFPVTVHAKGTDDSPLTYFFGTEGEAQAFMSCLHKDYAVIQQNTKMKTTFAREAIADVYARVAARNGKVEVWNEKVAK